MDFSDSGELYTIRQQFFAGQYAAVAETPVESFTAEARPAVQLYVARSQIALGAFSEALATAKALTGITAQTLIAFIKYAQGKGATDLEGLLAEHPTEEIVQIMGSLYLVREKRDLEGAIALLSSASSSLEALLLLLQVRILNNQLSTAVKELQSVKKMAQDSIIIQLAEALVNASVGGESELQQAYYFFEEISSQWLSFSNLVNLLAVNLQLNRLPESEETIKLLQALLADANGEGEPRGDFLANQLTYALMTEAGDERVAELRAELALIEPNHPSVVEYAAKNRLFDEIVVKYQT